VTFLEASGEKSFAHKAVNESARFFENYTIELKQPRQYYERDSKTDERRIRFFSGYAVTEGLFRPFSNSGGPYGGSGDYFGLCGETAATGALVIALDRIQFGTFDKATNKQDNTAKVLEDGATWWVKPQMRFCATGKSARGSRAVIIQRAE
jgi:hypothetical protein